MYWYKTIGSWEILCASVGSYQFQMRTINCNTAGTVEAFLCQMFLWFFNNKSSFPSVFLFSLNQYLKITFGHDHLACVKTRLVNRPYNERNCLLLRCNAVCPGGNSPNIVEEHAATSFRVDLKVEAACFSETCKFVPHYMALCVRRLFPL
jgi:hypothetical protein